MGNIIKYQNPSSPLINRVNKSKANFVKRLLDPNRKVIQNWVNPLDVSTHKLGWATEDTKQGAFVYPEVQEINGELIDFTHPSHLRSEGMNSAIERRDTVRMTPEQAKWFTENYKEYYPGFKGGGNIHIKPENKGKFTDYCGGKVTQECIQIGKHSSDPTIRKRATFAANARKWKHENGGILKYKNPATTLDLPEGSEYGGELEPAVVKPKPYLGILNTHYPIISKYPFTGHSELDLCDSNGVYVDHISKYGDDYDYNLVTNNCSDATRRAVEQIFNEKINPSLFTTPGDVRDFLLKKGVDTVDTAKGVETQYFEIPFATAMDLKNQNIDFHIQDRLKKAEKYKKDMEKWAKSHDRKWNSSGYDESTTKIIEELENQKYKFQPFKNKNGGILKAFDCTIYTKKPT